MKQIILQLCVVVALGFTGAVNAQYSIAYSGDQGGVFTVEVGSTLAINYTYSAAAETGSQFQVFSTPLPGIFDGGTPDVAEDANITFANPTLAAGTDVVTTLDINVPLETTLSADLPSDREYRIFGKLAPTGASEAFWEVGGAYPVLNVVASGTLGTNSFNTPGQAATLYMNNATKSLIISRSLDSSLNIVDMTGRVVMTVDASETKSVSLASLRSGIYFASNNDRTKAFKFAL